MGRHLHRRGDGRVSMTGDVPPWKWTNLRRGPTKTSEGAVVVGGFLVVFGLALLVATLFFGYGIRGFGMDPQLTSYFFTFAFCLLGVLGMRLGVRQHRFGRGGLGPRRDRKPR